MCVHVFYYVCVWIWRWYVVPKTLLETYLYKEQVSTIDSKWETLIQKSGGLEIPKDNLILNNIRL